jgi:hypothetical protein
VRNRLHASVKVTLKLLYSIRRELRQRVIADCLGAGLLRRQGRRALLRALAGLPAKLLRRCRCGTAEQLHHHATIQPGEVKFHSHRFLLFIEHNLANSMDSASIALNTNRSPYTSIDLHLEHPSGVA